MLLSPLVHNGTPHSMEEIETRIEELGFKTHFMREMQMVARATVFSNAGAATEGRLDKRLRDMHFHMIDTANTESLQRSDTKMLAHGPFLEALCKQGRQQGAQWLAHNADAVGRQSTIDVQSLFA